MRRRNLLAGAATLAAARSFPAIAQTGAQGSRVLRFVPQANLANPDPVWTTTVVAANHAYMIWDLLWGLDEKLTPQYQMLAGAETSDDKRTWHLTLREGLLWHDGAPVRGVDCIASLARWMKRDGFGQRIASQLEEMKPVDDRRFDIVLKKPFPLLPYACTSCFIMPERMAKTDAFQQIGEYVGSGPYRFVRDQWVSGSRAVYERFDKYVPRAEPPSFTAGAKRANFDRVEWIVMPDPATAAAALQTGEVDWVEQPLSDLVPTLRRAPGVVVDNVDLLGSIGIIRFNHLQPPFNNVKLRRALLPAVDQSDFVAAVMGPEAATLGRTGIGVWAPGTPMATDAGLEVLTGKRDVALAKKLVAESGYKGEKVVLMAPTDFPVVNAIAQVTRGVCEAIGLNVEYVSTDWGTLVARRASKEPVEKGGWSIFCTYGDGLSYGNPGTHTTLWGNGLQGWFGWYDSPRMEALRGAWFDAPDLETQKKLGREMQLVAMDEVPYIPIGLWYQPIGRRTNVNGILKATRPLFWEVRKT